MRGLANTSKALVTASAPGAEASRPALYVQPRAVGDRSARTEAVDVMATGEGELAPGRRQETELRMWRPPTACFSINAFYTCAGLRN